MSSSWNFWKTMREVSPRVVEEEADAPFRLALIGDSAGTARLRDLLLTEKATPIERENAADYVAEKETAPDMEASPKYVFVLYAPESGDTTEIGARGANGVPIVGTPEAVAAGMIAQRPDLAVALGRRFPLLRAAAANKVINDTARSNAQFALLSALPGVVPITGIFLPATSIADTLILTKNQIVLIMRLAAIHGHKPGYTQQVKELLGTIGSALGWRTLARELVGFVPAGVGAALKGAIAYSGTFALGKAAFAFYQNGRVLSPPQIRGLYKSKMKEAKAEVEEIKREAR